MEHKMIDARKKMIKILDDSCCVEIVKKLKKIVLKSKQMKNFIGNGTTLIHTKI